MKKKNGQIGDYVCKQMGSCIRCCLWGHGKHLVNGICYSVYDSWSFSELYKNYFFLWKAKWTWIIHIKAQNSIKALGSC